MKKILAFLCVFMTVSRAAFAEEEIAVFLNGNKIEFDQPPIIVNDRTLVPMRAVFESFGLMVQWFEDEQRVTAFDENIKITFVIDKPYIYINDDKTELDVAPTIVGDRTLVPLRAIGESLDGEVKWDGGTRTVTITASERGSFNSDRELEQKVLELTNNERIKHGLKPLKWNEELAKLARAHSQDMVDRNFFSHENPDGKSPFDRMREAGIGYHIAAENIAAGQASPEKAVAEWMNSEGHRKNILKPELAELGVGIARGGRYGIYWTQTFAKFK